MNKQVLVWKTNFDTTAPFIDSTNTANNRYTNENDYTTTTSSRISSANPTTTKDKTQISSLREKSHPETSDERRARKVKFLFFFLIIFDFLPFRLMYSMVSQQQQQHVHMMMMIVLKLQILDQLMKMVCLV